MYPVTYTAKRKQRDYWGWLASIVSIGTTSLAPYDVPIFNEFMDVFPDDLSLLPLHRDIGFGIDLVPGATSISIALSFSSS